MKPSRRLSRSFKQSQQKPNISEKSDICNAPKPEFKTPTRPCSSRASAASIVESPQNSDAHHDIIWDPSSPQRLGKRTKRHVPGKVDISDIVSRIAPKHGRPEVSEPTLQQWIGDSATIPCTPDVEPPKNRRKSQRFNSVDDLLKLAKRFDLNLLHREDDEEEDEAEDEEDPNPHISPVQPQESLHNLMSIPQHTEDDLDLLFREPTQQTSASPGPTTQQTSMCPGPPTPKKPPSMANVDFPDDWDDDDPFLAEMMPNPEKIHPPDHCSTQKTSGQAPPASFVNQSEGSDPFEKVETENACEPPLANVDGFSSAVCMARNKPRSASPAHEQVPAASDFPDDDLDAFFLSEPIWDDPEEDDEMLCELCEDVENQMVHDGATVKPCPPKYSNPCALPQPTATQQFTFKRPGNPVSTVNIKPNSMLSNHLTPVVTDTVVKCSALEIEQKKHQAMERRRQRLREVQNLK
ncbi:ewing's tumor-associated antigen 1 isoform X2 [Stigmatopora argus]